MRAFKVKLRTASVCSLRIRRGMSEKMKKLFGILIFVLLSVSYSQAKEYQFVSIEGLVEQEVGKIIVPEIFGSAGAAVAITPQPGKRAQMLAKMGKKDGEIMRIFTYGLENPTTLRVPIPYYYLETMAFVKKGSGIVIRETSDLWNYKIVKVRGVKHTNNIIEGMPKGQVHDASSSEDMMAFLQAGRAEVALTNTVDGHIALRRLGYSNIVPNGKPLKVLDLYIYVHEKNDQLVPKLNEAIKKMKDSGELKQLIDRAEKEVIER